MKDNEKIEPIEGLDLTNPLNKKVYELECLEIVASKATKEFQDVMTKLGQVARKGVKPTDPRNSPSGKKMIEAVNAVRTFQKENFGIISEPGIIGPTTLLIRATIKFMKEGGEL